jgi:hypothetical protein
MESEEREDFGVLLTATLTLLGLIIGFTFSMAISRYDQRKNYEEEEANAIGTEYLRANATQTALAVMGMNDVLNTQGYTQAAWWNRIPMAAWGLMWASRFGRMTGASPVHACMVALLSLFTTLPQ